MRTPFLSCISLGLVLSLAPLALTAADESAETGFQSLFPHEGVPEGWRVSSWADVSKPGPDGAVWQVKDGVLHGSEPRGTWLVSEKEYGDFILEFDFKLGERGNSGCGLRFPGSGDPAFDGLELQMVDPRYYPSDMKVPPEELTGGLYRAVAPRNNVLSPPSGIIIGWNAADRTSKSA